MAAIYDDPDAARVTSRQMPIFARNARSICHEIELPWSEAERLYLDGLLSFDPGRGGSLDEAHEAEMIFLGTLVAAGCAGTMLQTLLRGLRAPYAYDLRRMFFDWLELRWRVLPGDDDPEAAFFALLQRLDDRHEREALLRLRNWLDEALDLARERGRVLAHGGRPEADGWKMRTGRGAPRNPQRD